MSVAMGQWTRPCSAQGWEAAERRTHARASLLFSALPWVTLLVRLKAGGYIFRNLKAGY